MKVKIALLIALLLLLCLPALSACGDDNTVKVGEFIYSDGKDGTYTLVGTKYDKKDAHKWPDTLEVPAEVDGNVVDGIFGAFNGCHAKKIVLPDTITFINDSFTDCYKLEELDIPAATTRIMGKSFENCPKLSETENGFTYVDNWAVDSDPQAVLATLRPGTVGSCDGVSMMGLMIEGDITLPDDFYYLGRNAFSDGDGRHNSRTIEGTIIVNELKENDFALQNVTLGKLVIKKSIRDISYLLYQSSVGELVINGEVISSLEPSDGDLKEAEKVTVAGGTFSSPMRVKLDCKELVIGAGVTSICANAIKSGTIKKITVEGNPEIAQNAFSQCKKLEEIEGPANLLLGMDTGFIKTLTVTEGHLSAAMLSGAISLESITLFQGVTVEENAFSGCTALKTAKVPVAALGRLPKSIVNLTLTDGTVLADEAFAEFGALETLTLPAGVISIGTDAFLDNAALRDVYYGGTVADWAKIHFANGDANPLSHAENLYVGGELVTEITDLASITPYAFYGYKNLTKVTFHWGLTAIPEEAFYGCEGLTSIEIPAGIKKIGKNAFGGCTALTSVTFAETTDWWRYENEEMPGTELFSTYFDTPETAAQWLSVYADHIWKRVAI